MNQPMENPDGQIWLAALQRRELLAFQHLHERYANALYLILLVTVQDIREADDILMEVFVEAYQQIEGYSPRQGSIWLWLLRITTPKIRRSREHIIIQIQKLI